MPERRDAAGVGALTRAEDLETERFDLPDEMRFQLQQARCDGIRGPVCRKNLQGGAHAEDAGDIQDAGFIALRRGYETDFVERVEIR